MKVKKFDKNYGHTLNGKKIPRKMGYLLWKYVQDKSNKILLYCFNKQKDFWGQSYKDFYTVEKIYKHVLKLENTAITRHFLLNVRTPYPKICIWLPFLNCWIGNLGTLFCTVLRCKKSYRIASWMQVWLTL